MMYGAIDRHARYSQIRIVDDEGRVVRQQRVLTSAERLVSVCMANSNRPSRLPRRSRIQAGCGGDLRARHAVDRSRRP